MQKKSANKRFKTVGCAVLIAASLLSVPCYAVRVQPIAQDGVVNQMYGTDEQEMQLYRAVSQAVSEGKKTLDYTFKTPIKDKDTFIELCRQAVYQVRRDYPESFLDNHTDFMYYYDNSGVLRGEVPLLGYRSHRLLFDDNFMYYSISEKRMAQVNRLGQVTKVYNLGDYSLHHDYVFDENGNVLILATDTTQDSVEDIVLKLDVNSGEVTEVLDLGDLFGDYKKTCVKNSSDELDWMHINTIQYMGNGSVLLSSRETSTIIKVDNLYDEPSIAYMIGEKDFWEDTSYISCLLNKKGDFTIQGGQHTITYETDESLADGQYYLYMFNNNIGISETRPDYDWSSIGLKTSSEVDGKNSKYYKYLVDENEGTFELVDSFKVPYSGYVSSAQDIGDNVLTDSGLKGTFTEYDEDHKAIATYKMDYEKFIYRVFKYNFEGFYFGKSE